MSSNYGGNQTSGSWTSDYCYGQGYEAASGDYSPSTSETVAQGGDVAFCSATGNSGSYEQGYKDGYTDTNVNASMNSTTK